LVSEADHNKSGIYKLQCKTYNKVYIGQTNRNLSIRYSEHIRYIKNDPQSAYVQHILRNIHEYGTLTDTMSLLKHIHNPTKLILYEQLSRWFFIYINYRRVSFHTAREQSTPLRVMRFVSFPEPPDRLWGPPTLLFIEYLSSFPGVNRPGNEVDRLPSSSFEVKNEWSYTSTPNTPSLSAQGQFYLHLNFHFPKYSTVQLLFTM
jgi:hypothetical protein